ncbi:MAG: type II toxin-antitoxin system prevent-host-death family antitoxin [Pseudomonadota bacterium]
MSTVNIHEAKTHLSRLIAEVEKGGEVTIARDGKPVVKLIPVEAPPQRQFGSMKGMFPCPPDSAFAPLTDEEMTEYGFD